MTIPDLSNMSEILSMQPPALPEAGRPDMGRVRRIIAEARVAGRTLLTEAEPKDLQAAYALPVTPAVACRTADQAADAARLIGFPVVLKLRSTRLTHKSDVVRIQLNLVDEKAVRAATDRNRAGARGPTVGRAGAAREPADAGADRVARIQLAGNSR
jgi:acyl-CoA synthetase (NDP forming)